MADLGVRRPPKIFASSRFSSLLMTRSWIQWCGIMCVFKTQAKKEISVRCETFYRKLQNFISKNQQQFRTALSKIRLIFKVRRRFTISKNEYYLITFQAIVFALQTSMSQSLFILFYKKYFTDEWVPKHKFIAYRLIKWYIWQDGWWKFNLSIQHTHLAEKIAFIKTTA